METFELQNNLRLERDGDTISITQEGYYKRTTIATFEISQLEEEIGKLSNDWNLEGLMEDTSIIDGIKEIVKGELATYFLGGSND